MNPDKLKPVEPAKHTQAPLKRKTVADVIAEARSREKAANIEVAPEPIKPRVIRKVDDTIPAVVTAAEMMKGHKNHMQNLEDRKLKTLAKRYPEVGRLISKTAEPKPA